MPAPLGASPETKPSGPHTNAIQAKPTSHREPLPPLPSASGEKAKARDILAAIRTLRTLELEHRRATPEERRQLMGFAGFGPVALTLFPDPVKGVYKDAGWQVLGEELKSLLTPEEYASARATVFNAFYTSPEVIAAMQMAITRLGVPAEATILEPGCGSGNFISGGQRKHRYIGVEMDGISGRIARLLHPEHDIRIENFRDTKLAEDRIDAVIGNVPFADVKLDYQGQRLSLHDFFFAKSLEALKPEGILALVTSHYTLDKQNAALRESLAQKADFVAAIRLPSDAFRREGTSVVTDIIFLRKRVPGEAAKHADPEWTQVGMLPLGDSAVPVSRYFLNHPEMVLGRWSRQDTLYGGEGYSLKSNGTLKADLERAIARLPQGIARLEPSAPAREIALTPPPPVQHLTEGSFFVGSNKQIHQIHDGQGTPVIYGGTALRADGTMTGRRLALLIELRDYARRVLQSQNEGWPDSQRDQARRDLNRCYDRFHGAFGPINHTSFGETADGSVIRRMPNLVKFREDPDAMLVMSLEEYDEISGKASKAAILRKDVVGRTPAITKVQSAEEGLLVSLNQRGLVDLPFIASLYGKTEASVIAELGDLIFLDPQTSAWETADAYLSGNVRAKLAQAEAAGAAFGRNAEALREVQPEDVLPGDIDANLGAPWIPTSDLEAFACHLFQAKPGSVQVGHLLKDALWSIEADSMAEQSVAAGTDYGTPRANGVHLLELALNMKSPTIYDTVRGPDGDTRVINQDATLAAREKQKRIKEAFRSWLFADPERTERLVRIYNDHYNNIRPRLFDGSHLDFPGMNPNLTMRPHQANAIWRGMSAGNTLLAHCVGAGKTFTMAATAMKMKQAGLIKKPMIVVPNHLLEQFSREFMQLYPNARLLVATKEDLTREKRKFLTAKIASGDWEGIIVTHSSFEKIGMSRDYQEKFLRAQIAEYDQLLCEHAGAKGTNRNLIKSIEKQKAARSERLKDLLAEDKKDDGLVFDELGVDHLFVDEAHYFKNLETPTKMDRVAGIQTGGSERAFDMFMKARYLHEQHAGHGLTFATGTPISNTMVELYTMQRFLDPEGLSSRGIEHFDGWAANFGEVVESMELSPDGASLRPRSRFARFTNLPELQLMFRQFADVQTEQMLNLPRPALRGGKAEIVACPMSADQTLLQQELVERYERLRSQKIDPREDNALAITTDGRKLATDARMLSASAPENPESKIHRLTENVARIWRETTPGRGTQMIFCDLGINPTDWGYAPYEEIISQLESRGIPRDQIAAMGEAESDAKKQALFERVRNGSLRVLLGSTQKMGTGTNVQRRLVALHHFDAPWKPAEVEQRDGRILRQGNENREVAIYRYVTEGSFDAFMWQALETKAKFIGQVISGENAARRADDIGGQELSYAEVKAIASGNPAVLTLAETDAELQRLAMLHKNHLDEQFVARRKLRELPNTISRLSGQITRLTEDGATVRIHANDPIVLGSRPWPRGDAPAVLMHRLDTLPARVPQSTQIDLGRFRGLRFGLVLHPDAPAEVLLEGATIRTLGLSKEHQGARAILNAAERIANGYEAEATRAAHDLAIAETQLRDYQARQGTVFAHEEYRQTLRSLRDQLRDGLSANSDNEGPQPDEIVRRIKAIRECHTVDTESRRTNAAITRAPEPVTTLIRRKDEERSNPVPAAAGGDRPAWSFQEQETGRQAARIHEAAQAL